MTNISEWIETWTGDHCEGDGGALGGTQWHVAVDAPAMNGYYISLSAGIVQDDEIEKLGAAVTENGTVYTYYKEDFDSGLQKTIDIAVFDEAASIDAYMNEPDGYTASVTGDIVFNGDDGWYFYITGDGTITITAV